ncbi:MAG: M23 family metallopeptidase [Caulobacteraceae bacterium]
MARTIERLAPAALLAALMLAPGVRAADHKASATQIEVTTPVAPAPVQVGGARRLFYEFHLANYGRGAISLDEMRVSDPAGGAILNDIKGAALAPLLYQPGLGKDAPDPRRLAGGSFAILDMETTLPAGAAVPDALAWRLTTTDASSADAGKPLHDVTPIEGAMALDRRPPVTIGFPFRGGDWVAANGPSNTSGHRRTIIVVDGNARIAQRFAIDWVKLGPDGTLFHGDKAVNANWYGFGTSVIAVADATVSAAHNGVPENEPSDKRAVPITLETIGGNYLILDLGAGRHAFYAHLQPGSQKVRVGDKVRRGQALALLGNTGNSDAPHLHFHVSDGNSPLGAEGVPYVFDAYESLGTAATDQLTSDGAWKAKPGQVPQAERRALPAEDEVVRVP